MIYLDTGVGIGLASIGTLLLLALLFGDNEKTDQSTAAASTLLALACLCGGVRLIMLANGL